MGIVERKLRQRQAVRTGILAAAREIASDGGWQSVTIRGIAERIEYSPPVIYEHFASKEEILSALMRQGYAEQLEAVERARRTVSDPEGALIAIGHAWLEFAFRAPDLYQVMYGLGGVPFSSTETRLEGEKIAEPVARVIEAILCKHGRPVADAASKVLLLWSAMHGLAALTMVGRIPGGPEQAGQLAEEVARTCLAAWSQ